MNMVAWRLARRELRGGLGGFRVFLICLALGVAAIAAVGSLSSAITTGLQEDARQLLGGDLEVRQLYTPITEAQRAFMDEGGTVSAYREMRAMARLVDVENPDQTLISLKAVDDLYPVFGAVDMEPAIPRAEWFAPVDGLPAAIVDGAALRRLGLGVGDRIQIGDGTFVVVAELLAEPDRLGGGGLLTLGPRVIIADGDLEATGLVQTGSLIYHYYKLTLPEGADVQGFREDLGAAFPDAAWRVRDFSEGAQGLREFVGRLAAFLTLVGLTALLVGGVGVANGVRAYLDAKGTTIATLKCVGARNRTVFATYLIQIMLIAAVGTVIGLVLGAVAPLAVMSLLAEQIGVDARFGIYPLPLAVAAVFGLLTALTFTIWPLARAREVPPARLFRDIVAPNRRWPSWPYVVGNAVAAMALAAVAILAAEDRMLAAIFVAGAVVTLLAFRFAATLLMWLARKVGRPRRSDLRLGLSNVYRPGAPTPSVVLSLGLGLTVLVTVALIEGNMRRAVQENIPDQAPAYFFIDIQPDQAEQFDIVTAGVPGTGEVDRVPMLRGRIVAINGEPVENVVVDPDAAWALRSERGLTYATDLPDNAEIVSGQWWPADYSGPPLISFSADLAAGFGIQVGDTLTINVLGREVTAEIANLRRIDWGTMQINFTIIFAPGALEAAPHTQLATAQAEPEAELALERAVTDAFPNVSAINVRDALDTANDILSKIGLAVTLTGAVTLIAGTVVLAGAVAAGHRRRVYDSVVLKVLGATRAIITRAFLIEFGLLGVATAVIAAAIGTLAAYVVVAFVMQMDWAFLPETVVMTVAISLAITLALGFIGTWRALGQKAAPILRHP